MKRDFLEDLGIDSETAGKIMAEYGKSIQEYKNKVQDVDAKDEEIKALQANIDDRDKRLKELSKQVEGNDDLKAKFDAEIEKGKKEREALEDQLTKQRQDYSLDLALRNAGARNSRAVKALIDSDVIKFDENGKPTSESLEQALDPLRKSDSYLFKANEVSKPAPRISATGNPSSNDNSASIDLRNASYKEVMKFKAEHPEAYERLEKGES